MEVYIFALALMEPILKGSRLGSSWDDAAMMSELLKRRGVTTVRLLLELAGAKMEDAVSLARKLEVRSLRIVGLMLTRFKQALSDDDKRFLIKRTVSLACAIDSSSRTLTALVLICRRRSTAGHHWIR